MWYEKEKHNTIVYLQVQYIVRCTVSGLAERKEGLIFGFIWVLYTAAALKKIQSNQNDKNITGNFCILMYTHTSI